jgi:hypothetical protein
MIPIRNYVFNVDITGHEAGDICGFQYYMEAGIISTGLPYVEKSQGQLCAYNSYNLKFNCVRPINT